MCLLTKQYKQKKADRDIIVFKIVVFRDSQTFTPYTGTPIPYELLNGQKPFEANGRTEKCPDFYGYTIEGGNIHTYAIAADAWQLTHYFPKEWGQPAVYECIIPKGTEYYYGCTYGKTPSYASKQIRFVKRLQNPNAPKPIQTKLDLR